MAQYLHRLPGRIRLALAVGILLLLGIVSAGCGGAGVASSSNSAVTRAVSAGAPVAVISLPRTWMSASNSRSITCSSSSPEPSRLTIE